VTKRLKIEGRPVPNWSSTAQEAQTLRRKSFLALISIMPVCQLKHIRSKQSKTRCLIWQERGLSGFVGTSLAQLVGGSLIWHGYATLARNVDVRQWAPRCARIFAGIKYLAG
jgi:hypothetical protein